MNSDRIELDQLKVLFNNENIYILKKYFLYKSNPQFKIKITKKNLIATYFASSIGKLNQRQVKVLLFCQINIQNLGKLLKKKKKKA